ncbi:MAG: hypothetical protein NTX15_06630 [Candidatus Kapabacteria bacterium]|nr:hypothetical protein [Candidatus Kapabacteria bacterium]
MMRYAFIVVVLTCVPLVSFSQGGSNYSSIGLGDIRRSVGALYDGMAGTSIAMASDHGINIVNPALLGMSVFTRLQVGYKFSQHHVSDNGSTVNQNNGEIDGLLALFAIDTAHGFGISFGVLPYSSVNYIVKRDLLTDIDGTPLSGKSVQTGTGGTSSIQIGASGRLGNFYGGVSIQTLFGVITLADDIYANGLNERVRSTASYDVRGVLFRGGLYYRATPNLSLGAFVSGGPTGTMNTVYRAAGELSGNKYFDSSVVAKSSTQFPFGFGIGASIRNGRSTYGVDLEWADHSRVDVNPRSDATYVRSLRATFGFNRPAASYTPTFVEKLGYRAGFGFQRQYYTFKGAGIDEYFPLGSSSTVDFSVQGGYRGPSTGALYEYFVRVTTTISIGETWFKPFARD